MHTPGLDYTAFMIVLGPALTPAEISQENAADLADAWDPFLKTV